MSYTVESLETYAHCPRQYKFKYIEKAPHSITFFELFCMAHRKATLAHLTLVKEGKALSATDYYSLWEDEWESKKTAVGRWPYRHEKGLPERAKLQSTVVVQEMDWPQLQAVETMERCRLGLRTGPEIYVNVDFKCRGVYGMIGFAYAQIAQGYVVTSYTANALHSLEGRHDIWILAFGHSGKLPGFRHIVAKLHTNPSHRIMASLLDQVQGIEAGSFPRCHPTWKGCSPKYCGYTRICTNLMPDKRTRVKEWCYVSEECWHGVPFGIGDQ